MRQTIQLGRVQGIPVGVHWSVLVVLLLLVQGLAVVVLPQSVDGYSTLAYWLAGAGFTGLFMAALLGHELAHALTARHYGVQVRAVTLWLLGGVSELEGEPPHPRADLAIALAGPLASMGAAAACAGGAWLTSWSGTRLLGVGFGWLAVVNALMAVFNLLPGAPLDGGRVLAALVWRVGGDRALGRRAAARAGVVLGVLMSAAGIFVTLATGNLGGVWLVLIGWYLVGAARSEASAVRLTSALAGLRVEQVMSAPPVCGYAGQSVTGFVVGPATAFPHHAYPVMDLDGRLAGLATLGALATVPAARRSVVRLIDVAVPVSRIRTVEPQTPLIEAATLLNDPYRLAVVVVRGRPCGVLSAGDILRAMDIAELGGAPDRTRANPPDREHLGRS